MNNITITVLGALVTIIAGVIAFFKWKYTYWKTKGLTTITPTIPFGSIKDAFLGKYSFAEQFSRFYNECKAKGLPHAGVYIGYRPYYLAIDPKIIKHILQIDFQNFVNRIGYLDAEGDPLWTLNLFNLEDVRWRHMRTKLTPTFTSGKMKMMFHTISDCAVGLEDALNKCAKEKIPLEVKEILACFTTDVIGSCAFGIECNTLKDPNADFRLYGRLASERDWLDTVKSLVSFALPDAVLKVLSFKYTKASVEKFFMAIVKDVVEHREKNKVYRKDFMHLLLQLKNKEGATDEDGRTAEGLTMDELSAQVVLFFLAGLETSTATMAFALYEIALNPDIQDKLRDEIRSVSAGHNDRLTYEGVMEMTYMEKVFCETLRKYPAAPNLQRRCTKEYTIPDTSIRIEKGTDVSISVLGLHHDPEYYPDPERFDPERFSEENKKKRPAFTWLAFGEGPRFCIGERFGKTSSKIGLATVVKNYRIKLNKKTNSPLPLKKRSFALAVEGGIWLDIERLEEN